MVQNAEPGYSRQHFLSIHLDSVLSETRDSQDNIDGTVKLTTIAHISMGSKIG